MALSVAQQLNAGTPDTGQLTYRRRQQWLLVACTAVDLLCSHGRACDGLEGWCEGQRGIRSTEIGSLSHVAVHQSDTDSVSAPVQANRHLQQQLTFRSVTML